MNKSHVKTLATKLPVETYDAIEDYAIKRGMTASNLLRLALLDYLNQNGLKITMDELMLGGWGGLRKRDNEHAGESKEGEMTGESARDFNTASNLEIRVPAKVALQGH